MHKYVPKTKTVTLSEGDWNEIVMTCAIYGPQWIIEKLRAEGVKIPHWVRDDRSSS
jgi:hypothetical protein